jgi:hypothetical protein
MRCLWRQPRSWKSRLHWFHRMRSNIHDWAVATRSNYRKKNDGRESCQLNDCKSGSKEGSCVKRCQNSHPSADSDASKLSGKKYRYWICPVQLNGIPPKCMGAAQRSLNQFSRLRILANLAFIRLKTSFIYLEIHIKRESMHTDVC